MPRTEHYQVTWGGGFGAVASPAEQWQTSCRVDNDSPATAETTDVILSRATALHGSFATLIMPRLQAGVFLAYCDIRKINAGGLQPRNSDGSFAGAARFTATTPVVNAGTPRYPYQVAMVATLLTPRQGPRGKGRMYFPPPALDLGNDGRVVANGAQDFAFGVAQLLSAVNGQFGNEVSVMSTFGTASLVTGVRVGRVLDTHRSRRRDLLEAPSNVEPVTNPG